MPKMLIYESKLLPGVTFKSYDEALQAEENLNKRQNESSAMEAIGKYTGTASPAMAAASQAGPDAWATAPKDDLQKISEGQVLNEMYGKNPIGMARDYGITANPAEPAKAFVGNLKDESDLQAKFDLQKSEAENKKEFQQNQIEAANQRAKEAIDAENKRNTESIQGRKDIAAMIHSSNDFQEQDIKPGSLEDIIAQKLATGNLPFSEFVKTYPGFSKNAIKRAAILGRAYEINPDLNIAEQQLSYKWGGNPAATKTIAAANNALANIDKMVDLSDQWKRTGSPLFNKLLKEGQFQIGNQTVSNIKEMQIAVGDEVAGVLGYGTSSDLKTKLGLDLMDPNISPENFQSNMKILKHLLDTRRQTMAEPMGSYAERPGIRSVNKEEAPSSDSSGTTSSGNRFIWQ